MKKALLLNNDGEYRQIDTNTDNESFFERFDTPEINIINITVNLRRYIVIAGRPHYDVPAVRIMRRGGYIDAHFREIIILGSDCGERCSLSFSDSAYLTHSIRNTTTGPILEVA